MISSTLEVMDSHHNSMVEDEQNTASVLNVCSTTKKSYCDGVIKKQ
jgi:hypothetical protein